MPSGFRFSRVERSASNEALREEVREFLARQREAGGFTPSGAFGGGFSAEFSRKLGRRGWIGMTWPKTYGGHERSYAERYTVTEELLAAGAPVRAHWVADRQSGPLILQYGTEPQRQAILPRIAKGELCFCIGMSEPDAGSDIASVKTRAEKAEGGWRVNGTKIWTSNAHRAQYMIGLFRTSPAREDNRRFGLTQFLVDMQTPGIAIRPIEQLDGEHDFNEVFFDDVFLPEDALLGRVDHAFQQASTELAYERSGPERFLSTYRLLVELIRPHAPEPGERAGEGIGRLVAQLWTLRQMSLSVAGMLQAGETPSVEAALVKDIGTNFEKRVPEVARLLAPEAAASLPPDSLRRFEEALSTATLLAPALTIRGGTQEILRGLIARGLGLR